MRAVAAACTNLLDTALVVLIAGLAVLILADSFMKWYQLLTGRRPLVTSEVPFAVASQAAPPESSKG